MASTVLFFPYWLVLEVFCWNMTVWSLISNLSITIPSKQHYISIYKINLNFILIVSVNTLNNSSSLIYFLNIFPKMIHK